MKQRIAFLLLMATAFLEAMSQSNPQWDSIKQGISPVVAPALSHEYNTPYRQPLSSYGWEDGLHISRDGHHLYALYYPGDLFGLVQFVTENVNELSFCQLFGDTTFIRHYAEDFGADMTTNAFGCDNFLNIDILYSNRENVNEGFQSWQLSNLARPGDIEGGAYPLFNRNSPSLVDIFLFTGNSDIWMIRNTPANPENIAEATRLPAPINPESDEFTADNPHLERLPGDTLLLVYEKYTHGDERTFMYSFSLNNGVSWTSPSTITTIHHEMGKIEHPHLYQEPSGDWYLYYSLNCDIYRSKQEEANHWDAWSTPELVIGKGNATCVGEPSLTLHGDISFVVVYPPNLENNDSTDTYDLDPWYLPKKKIVASSFNSLSNETTFSPNPFLQTLVVESEHQMDKVTITDLNGRLMYEMKKTGNKVEIDLEHLVSGIYLLRIISAGQEEHHKIVKR